MTHSPVVTEPTVEAAPSTAITGVNGFHLEPRCRVCRNDEVRTKVNDFLAAGASYAMIVRALQDDNAELDNRDRVTIDSVRNHSARHFPVQNVAAAPHRPTVRSRLRHTHRSALHHHLPPRVGGPL
jgi:hypothetical protein